MKQKNKIGCLVGFIALLVISYIILSIMKFVVNVTLKIAWFALIIFLIMWLFKVIFGKKN